MSKNFKNDGFSEMLKRTYTGDAWAKMREDLLKEIKEAATPTKKVQLTKEEFIDYMNTLRKMENYERTLYDLSEGGIRLFDVEKYTDLLNSYISLLNQLMGLKPAEYVGTLIEYFIYDLDYGEEDVAKDAVIDNGRVISLTTVEELYDYIVECAKNDTE